MDKPSHRDKVSSIEGESMSTLEQLAQSDKYSESITELKTKMKDQGNIDCSCILCRGMV